MSEAGDLGEAPSPALLAVDLGLRSGLAWFVQSPEGLRLVRHRCTEFHTRARLKAAVGGILREVNGLVAVIGEGDRTLWAFWEKAAAARGIEVSLVSPERWRVGLWGAAAPTAGKEAKALARRFAEGAGKGDGLVARLGQRGVTPMRTDAAEAVCLGYWAALARGWKDGGRDG